MAGSAVPGIPGVPGWVGSVPANDSPCGGRTRAGPGSGPASAPRRRSRAPACDRVRFHPFRRKESRTGGRDLRTHSRAEPRCSFIHRSQRLAMRSMILIIRSMRSDSAPGSRSLRRKRPGVRSRSRSTPPRRSRPRRPRAEPRSGRRSRRADQRRRHLELDGASVTSPTLRPVDAALVRRDRRERVDPELGEVLLALERLAEGHEPACASWDPIQHRAPRLGQTGLPATTVVAQVRRASGRLPTTSLGPLRPQDASLTTL